MNKKKFLIIFLVLVVLVSIGIGAYVVTKEDQESTLNLVEKQWIESNKNKVIDLGMINQIPVLNYDGEGVLFDFVQDLEEDTGLSFNKVAYSFGEENSSDYAFQVVDKLSKDDILIYEDYYALLTKNHVSYNQIRDIKDITVGVYVDDLEKVSNSLVGANVVFKTYDSIDAMLKAISKSAVDEVDTVLPDAIVLPKLAYLDDILGTYDLTIAYNITDLKQNYVLSLGSTDRLNDILKKYYEKWFQDNYQDSYSNYFTDHYFKFTGVEESEKVNFRSKRYQYGFVDNAPFDSLADGKLVGINNVFMKAFSQLTDVEISFQSYDSVSNMVKAFNENKLDFFYSTNYLEKYKMDVYQTASVSDEKVVVISPIDSKQLVSSVHSLDGIEVYTIKDSKIAHYLESNGVKVKTYSNMADMLEKHGSHILAMDYDSYMYCNQTGQLVNYKIDYEFYLNDNYYFLIRDIKENKVFSQFFDFYLSYVPETLYVNQGYMDAVVAQDDSITVREVIMTGCLILIGLTIVIIILKLIFGNKKSNNLSKEDKLKYIDMLTSLKNRNYLNDHIEAWDNSEVYPQSIVIVDLNNIAYINDNYGHAEGDKVIREAANILIQNQLENSEIIRTNGNEFLIYMVGYDEKQVVTYIRKLNKAFKDLSHGFGAASGYSMIFDAIKTIDDAVNEATLDMRNNKEELR